MSETAVDRVIPEKKFNQLLRAYTSTRQKMQSLAGDIGQMIADAVEKNFLHKGAFSLIAKLHKMDELKRNDFLRAFDIYRERMEAKDWGSGKDLMDGAADGDSSDGDEPAAETQAKTGEEIGEENARKVKRGIKPLADKKPPVVGMPGAEPPTGTIQ